MPNSKSTIPRKDEAAVAKIDKAVTTTPPASCESTCAIEINNLKKTIAERDKTIAERDKTIQEMLAERDKTIKELLAERDETIKEIFAKLKLYESANMPTSSPSLYNAERNKFRKERGEDTGGSPGDKAKTDGKKLGPPVGHTGVSHDCQPSDHLRYQLEPDTTCPNCGSTKLERIMPIHKLVSDLDETGGRVVTAAAHIQRAVCTQCNYTITAPTPILEGTSLGPNLLALIHMYFGKGCVDDAIAEFLLGHYNFDVSPNTIAAARRAMAEHLKREIIGMIMQMIKSHAWVQMDETTFKRGDGQFGYAWVVRCEGAAFAVFADSRKASVLETYFGWLKDKAAVCDGYQPYQSFFKIIQRCWRHILAKAEEAAIRGNEEDKMRYNTLLAFYSYIKKIKTLTPFTLMELTCSARKIAMMFDGKLQTLLLNAMPYMFTFLLYPGMPAHNNDTEILIRDSIIPQRRTRHKTVTKEGRDVMSALVSYIMTCHIQGISSCRAMLECLLDPNWNIFESNTTTSSLVNADGSRYSIFDHPGPPAEISAAPRGQTAVMPVLA